MESRLTDTTPKKTISRIKSLDYLRGLMAVAIMVYHYYGSTFHKIGSESVLGRLGIYGVSIFYILSGLTLYVVYKNSLYLNFKSILSFIIKRIFRIFPLLWVTLSAVLIIRLITSANFPSMAKIVANYTGLFGFIKPDAYLAVGQWSIGNELVFYAFFPLFLILSNSRPILFYLLLLVSFGVGMYFAFGVLTDEDTLSDQWLFYINPFNQLLLFTSGIFIGYLKQKINFDRHTQLIAGLLLVSILLFIFYPTAGSSDGDKIDIVVGFNRVIFVIVCIVISAGFYLLNLSFRGWIDRVLSILGDFSYSLYLLHPIVYMILRVVLPDFLRAPIPYMFLCMLISFIVSFCVYKIIEMPLMSFGKRLTLKWGLENNK